jgi:hypothetical protein
MVYYCYNCHIMRCTESGRLPNDFFRIKITEETCHDGVMQLTSRWVIACARCIPVGTREITT